MKKLKFLTDMAMIALFFMLLPCSCHSQNNYPWTIKVLKVETKDVLHTDAGVAQYDGSIQNVAYDNQPDVGYSFLIISMNITKAPDGKLMFDWNNLSVADNKGNIYKRMKNDSFLSVHTYNRMQGTPLMTGENKGSICFSVPNDVSISSLSLQYDFGDGVVYKTSLKGR